MEEPSSATVKPIPQAHKIDTIKNHYLSVQFNQSVFFGMSEAEWNKAIALETKAGIFTKLNDDGFHKTLSGFKPISEDSVNGYWILPIFYQEDEMKPDTVVLNYLNGKLTKEPLLNGIMYDFGYSNTRIRYVNSVVENLINTNELRFYTGAFFPLETESYVTDIRSLQKSVDFENSFPGDKIKNETVRKGGEINIISVYEDEQNYYVFKAIQSEYFSYDVNAFSQVTKFEPGAKTATLKVNLYSKKFPHPIMSKYNTDAQNEAIKAANKKEELINKALKE